MNICNIYRTVLIYLLLCYGKKFVNGDEISQQSQNLASPPNRAGITPQKPPINPGNPSPLNPLNSNPNSSQSQGSIVIDLDDDEDEPPTSAVSAPAQPAPKSAQPVTRSAPGHLDINLDSGTESEVDDDVKVQPARRKAPQKTEATETTTTGSEIEVESEIETPVQAPATQSVAVPAQESVIIPKKAQQQFSIEDEPDDSDDGQSEIEAEERYEGQKFETETVPGFPHLLILDLDNKYSTTAINYEYKKEENSHFYRPKDPFHIYQVKMGGVTGWHYSGAEFPIEVRLVPDQDGNPKLQVIFPEYSETETESELEPSRPMPRPAQTARPMPQPAQVPGPVPAQFPGPVPQPAQVPGPVPAQVPGQFPQPIPQTMPQTQPQATQFQQQVPQTPQPVQQFQTPIPQPMQQFQQDAAQYMPQDQIHQQQVEKPGEPPAPKTPELVSVDIKQFYSTDEIDYYYYDREKIHKFLCKPNYLIGAVLKDGKIKKQFSTYYPNRVLILKDKNNNPLVRILGETDEDPDEPKYLPQPRPKQQPESQMQQGLMQNQQMRDKHMRDQMMQDQQMRENLMRAQMMQDMQMRDKFMRAQMMQDMQMRDKYMRDQYMYHQQQMKKLQEVSLIKLNTDNKYSTVQYTYERTGTNTHLYTARKPHLFKLIMNNVKVLWQPKDERYPDRVIYKDPPGEKVRLQVAYPEDSDQLSDRMSIPDQMRRRPIVTEEVDRHKPKPNLVTVDINIRKTTDKVGYSFDRREQEDVFTAQSPYLISQANYGPETIWTAKSGNFADELRVTYDMYGTPSMKVYFPEKKPEPEDRLPRPPKPVPGTEVIQLADVEIKFFHNTNEIIYKYYPEYNLHKFLCRPEFLIGRIFKDGKLKKEFTDNYPNRLLIYKDENNQPMLRVLRADETDPDEPVDDTLPQAVPPRAPPEPIAKPPEEGVEPGLEYIVPYPEALPVRPEVPEVPEKPKEEVDYNILVGIQLLLNVTSSTDKFEYEKMTDTGFKVYTVKSTNAFSSIKFPKSFRRGEVTVWTAESMYEFAKKVSYKSYNVNDMEEINIFLFNGSKKKYIKSSTMPWREIQLDVDNIETIDVMTTRDTYYYNIYYEPSFVKTIIARHPFLFDKVIRSDKEESKQLIWRTNKPGFSIKKIERDGATATSSFKNISLFHTNRKITHLTREKDEWKLKSPHIELDINKTYNNLYYTYESFRDLDTFKVRNNVTFTRVKLGRPGLRVQSIIFINAPYGRYAKEVVTNVHHINQRTKYVSILFNDGNHEHYISPYHTRQWLKIGLEVEVRIDTLKTTYKYEYIADDQLPAYKTYFNFLFSRIMEKKSLIWSSVDNELATIIIMNKAIEPEYLAIFLNTGKTIFYKKYGRFWSKHNKFLPLHLEADHYKTTICILYKYDKYQDLHIYTPINGLFIKSVSYQNRIVWDTNNESEYARKVVMSETKLIVFQRNRMRKEFDRDLHFDISTGFYVLDSKYRG